MAVDIPALTGRILEQVEKIVVGKEEQTRLMLTAILSQNDIKSLTVVRMEVPCCGGIQRAAVTALQNSGKFLPWRVVTLSTDGRILEDL